MRAPKARRASAPNAPAPISVRTCWRRGHGVIGAMQLIEPSVAFPAPTEDYGAIGPAGWGPIHEEDLPDFGGHAFGWRLPQRPGSRRIGDLRSDPTMSGSFVRASVRPQRASAPFISMLRCPSVPPGLYGSLRLHIAHRTVRILRWVLRRAWVRFAVRPRDSS